MERFESFTRALAGAPMSRRKVIGLIGSLFAATVVGEAVGSRPAFASTPCETDSDCYVGTCNKGMCSGSSEGGSSESPSVPDCDSGQTMCSGSCVYTSSDANNCGSCGNYCSSGVCSHGSCTTPCEGTLCSGSCVDTSSDAYNCCLLYTS